MKPSSKAEQLSKSQCMSDMELYSYLTRAPGDRSLANLEAHLSTCSHCLDELAELIKLLHPETEQVGQPAQEASRAEIQETFALIQRVTGRESQTKRRTGLKTGWYKWGMAAAAAVVFLALALWGFEHWRDIRRSRAFYEEARAQLQTIYSPQSPSGLRLNLPFESVAVRRDSTSEDTMGDAERLFQQSLALHEQLTESHLGLGYIYIRKAQFSKALVEFQRAVNSAPNDSRALLGRAVALYEDGLATKDPLRRSSCLGQALADMDRILQKNPDSKEARFNKCLTLYEAGHHKEATREIEEYLAHDAVSSWAERLKAIQTQIQLSSSIVLEQEVDRAVSARNAERLRTLARTMPYQMPEMIRKMLRRTLETEDPLAQKAALLASDMRWAVETMGSVYGTVTGDRSYEELLKFYDGLSPPQRKAKRLLDARLQQLIDSYQKGELSVVLHTSLPLKEEFAELHDHWQLINLHHLRGNCFYYHQADFDRALEEYREMLRCAERAGNQDLIAAALGASAAVLLDTSRFDEARDCITRLQGIAATFHLDSWAAFAYCSQGELYLDLNQLQDSLDAYSSALSLGYRLLDESVVVNTLENMGTILERMDRLDEARKVYLEAMYWQDFFVQDGSLEIEASIKARRANLLHTQGRLALRMGDLTTAAHCFKQGQQLAAAGMREIEAKNQLGLVQVYLERKDYERARDELLACSATTASGEFPELEWQASSLAGILSRQLGNYRDAFTHFEHATKVLEAMRHRISTRELRYAFLNCRFDPYQELVSLLFHSEKDFPAALACVNRAKSMTLREYMEEKDRRLNPERSTASPTEGVRMPDGYSTIEYFSLPDELLAFVSGPDGVRGVSIPLGSAQLNEKVQKYLESIRGGDYKVFPVLSRDLYDQLVAPALCILDTQRINGLIFVPDGPLHVLPFASLRDPSGHYLLEKYILAYAPSQGVLRYCLSLNRANAARDKAVLLLDAASSLSGASEELVDIARIYGGKASLVGSSNLSSLDQKVKDATIIHFAGHATISSGKPKLVFGTSPMTVTVDSSRVGKWLLGNARLVWLAGCNTGIGPIAQGETCWGLVPAFLGAGAPAVVASLMPVDDAATRTLTVRFYDLLAHSSLSKAKALQQAQLSMLGNSAAHADSQPLQWAPFVLVGDPR